MSTFSTIGAGVVGGALALAGIVTVETRPTPQSVVVVCEYFEAAGGDLVAGRGCRQDGRDVRVIVANSSMLQVP